MKNKRFLIVILLCIFCLLPSIGLGIYSILSDDEDNGSCVSPNASSTVGYTVTSENLKKGEFIVNVRCDSGYIGNASATECNASGVPYSLSGCTTDPAANTGDDDDNNNNADNNADNNNNGDNNDDDSSPNNCSSTFTELKKDNTYNLIEGGDITNYSINSLKTLNPGKNCSGTGDNVSCNWDINASGVISCSEPSASGTILCNSSGIFELRNCSGVPVPPAPPPPPAGGPCASNGDCGNHGTCSNGICSCTNYIGPNCTQSPTDICRLPMTIGTSGKQCCSRVQKTWGCCTCEVGSMCCGCCPDSGDGCSLGVAYCDSSDYAVQHDGGNWHENCDRRC